MDELSERITKGAQPELRNQSKLTLNQCEVRMEDCFKEPCLKSELAQTVNQIKTRRESLRLQVKHVPCMKESPEKKTKSSKPKKKAKKAYLNDIKMSSIIKEGESCDPVNNHQIISNQYPELTDNDIVSIFCLILSPFLFTRHSMYD